MQIHELKRQSNKRMGRRIGRGGKRGTTSGRGTKGQKSRAGAKMRPAERELLKKIPKLRGYRFKSYRLQPVTVTIVDIEKKFKNGDIISPETMLKARLISKIKGKMPKVKILGKGKLTKQLIFKDVLFSKSVMKLVSEKRI